jgi:hypothetical protein
MPLPTQISGTSVVINGIAAPLLAVIDRDGEDQINFQVPHLRITGHLGLTIVVEHSCKTPFLLPRPPRCSSADLLLQIVGQSTGHFQHPSPHYRRSDYCNEPSPAGGADNHLLDRNERIQFCILARGLLYTRRYPLSTCDTLRVIL